MSLIAAQLARHLGAVGRVEESAIDRAVTVRQSSTANFLIDSVDRDADVYPSSGDFQIVKTQSIFNGFFNRMAVQEIVLDWGIPNISAQDENETFTVMYDDGVNPPSEHTAILPNGFYTVAQALDTIVSQLNVSIGTPGAFVIVSGDTGVYMDIDQLVVAGGTFEILGTGGAPNNYENNLGYQIFSSRQIDNGFAASYPIIAPRILPLRYLDFVCPQLTYNQELKDGDTSKSSRDVLYRWYFGWDTETSYDAYGFPILQGYRSFIQRRLIAFPKQIRWDKTQPVGNLSFQVYNDVDEIVNPDVYPAVDGGAEMEFQMTLLLSED